MEQLRGLNVVKPKQKHLLWLITTAQWTNQNSKQIHETSTERGKTYANKLRLVLVSLPLVEKMAELCQPFKEGSKAKGNYFRYSI